ncbi:uncharacterized protein LOC144433441 [Glandiceps talaboti]
MAAIENLEISEKPSPKTNVVYHLRDINQRLVQAWNEEFKEYNSVTATCGDIFKEAPSADAIVSPANSFGFMDGGIDYVYSVHFGWQMQERLQKVIREEKDGEILVGDVAIIPAYDPDSEAPTPSTKHNEGKLIKYLISAPTMRVPQVVANTVNAYLAFRAVILAVQKFNKRDDVDPIKSVLCPGLATSVGKMPVERCAQQMKLAYEINELGMHRNLYAPKHLTEVWECNDVMASTDTKTIDN